MAFTNKTAENYEIYFLYLFLYFFLFARLKSTPLLLAASSGALKALKCLTALGADIRRQDGQGNNIVVLASMRFHTNILEFLIEWNHPHVPVWRILVGKHSGQFEML